MKTVLACPECDAGLTHNQNHREWCDGGRRAEPSERWICRKCDTTFPEPAERPSKRPADHLKAASSDGHPANP